MQHKVRVMHLDSEITPAAAAALWPAGALPHSLAVVVPALLSAIVQVPQLPAYIHYCCRPGLTDALHLVHCWAALC